jgi:toxin CcdB
MAKFDVYRASDGGYLLDCQADFLASLNSRFVVPLRPTGEAPAVSARLNPTFVVEGREVVMKTHFAAAVDARLLREPVASLEAHDFTIGAALDLLTSGF